MKGITVSISTVDVNDEGRKDVGATTAYFAGTDRQAVLEAAIAVAHESIRPQLRRQLAGVLECRETRKIIFAHDSTEPAYAENWRHYANLRAQECEVL